ncbi:MAG: hypothetical protein IKW35_09355 [Paludibacteraceae bacterium]|nr:hypothetical protein [Paludibacteraceae bacterium]
MNAHADMFIAVGHNELNTPMGIYRSLALGVRNLLDFDFPKQAPINAFLLCLLPFAADVQTSPAQVHAAKVLLYFELSKREYEKKCHLCEFCINGSERMIQTSSVILLGL